MSTPFVESLNTFETGDDTHSLSGHEREVVNSATSILSTHATSEKVAGQIKAATDRLIKNLDRHRHLMKELQPDRQSVL